MRLILHLADLLVRGTALMLSLVGALLALACLGGAFSATLDVFTHLTPVWLCLGLVAAILGSVATRGEERGVVLALSALTIVVAGGLMAPELATAMRKPQKVSHGPTLKLVQFNVWADNNDPDATLAWVLAQNADVLMLEESAGEASWLMRKRLSKSYPYRVSCNGSRPCDTWILSRLPMVRQRGFYEDGPGLAGAWATLRHPAGDFTVVATHFVWPLPAGAQQAQSRLLVRKIAPFPKDTTIVTGDFNSTPWSFSLRRQDRALGLERRTRALASWPSGAFSRLASAPFPILPIDHVYAGKAWKTVKVERGPALGSDHRPVVVTLSQP
jgi:endonuclease/exonuclease/phosphatase (EEP) superfamily protein YafD